MADQCNTMTSTESSLAPIWCEILQLQCVAPDDNFFALGGDSMMMMMVQFRASEDLGVELAPGLLLEYPTLAEFSRAVDDARLTSKPGNIGAPGVSAQAPQP